MISPVARRVLAALAAGALIAGLTSSGARAAAPPTTAIAPATKAPPLPRLRPVKPPTITNVAPPAPLTGRAVELVLYGTDFSEDQAKIRVTCAGVEAASIDVQSPRKLRAVFPAFDRAGPADVVVTNPNGDRATLANAIYLRQDTSFSVAAMRYQIRYSWRGFVEWFNLGGKLMYVFLAISFFGVAWAVHCFLVLRRSQILPRRFMEALSGRLDQTDLKGAATACERSGCVFGRVILSGLRKAEEAVEAPDKVREAVGAAGSREAAHLQQKISYLANIGTISPMLGLLGTVFGMIMAFNIISSGEVRPYLLAAAIAQAMVTTAAGLVIGIPALGVYFYLRGRLLRLLTHMEVVADEVTGTIIEKAEEL